MNISEVIYLGNLRTEAKHLRSGEQIITDAPLDNKGKGEAFSPTDLMSTSLVNCMITVMGIAAQENDFDLGKVHATVKKVMASDPRRVSEIHVSMEVEGSGLSQMQKDLLKEKAKNCPVAQSLHPEIKQLLNFNFG